MNWMVGIRTAFHALRSNVLRTVLTMLGIVVGVAAVTTVVSIGEGARREVVKRLQSIGANLLLVLPGAPNEQVVRQQAGSRTTLSLRDADAIRQEVRGLVAVAPSVFGRLQVVHGNRNWQPVVQGINSDYLVAREWSVVKGRAFTEQELSRVGKVALIGATARTSLFGTANPIDRVIRINNVPFTVIGVLARKGLSSAGSDQDDRIFVPLSTARVRLFGGSRVHRDAIQYVMLKAAGPGYLATVRQNVTALLRQRHGIAPEQPDDFEVRDLSEVMAAREEASAVFGKALLAVALVSLLVGGVSIMNIMLVTIGERTREIGLRRAVGARARDIRRQFMMETLFICLVAGVIGAGVGIGGSYAVAALAGWPVIVSAWSVLLGFLCAAMVGVSFGLYPACKAARLEPIEALRFE
jgi:putative ABC transport system permease protein